MTESILNAVPQVLVLPLFCGCWLSFAVFNIGITVQIFRHHRMDPMAGFAVGMAIHMGFWVLGPFAILLLTVFLIIEARWSRRASGPAAATAPPSEKPKRPKRKEKRAWPE